MKLSELEALLGDNKRYLYPAYSKGYLRIARMNDPDVKPERMRIIIDSINQHVKELQALEKKLSNYNA